MRASVVFLLFLTVTNGIDVQLTIDSDVVRTIDTTQFLSFTFDTSFIRGDFCGINWQNAILLARSLRPCYVRVGGDDSDFMVFDESALLRRNETEPDATEILILNDTELNAAEILTLNDTEPNAAEILMPNDIQPNAAEPTPDVKECGMFESTFFNMTPSQFDRINWFVKSTGLRLMFDLNAVYDRHHKTASSSLNPANTIKLLNYAQEMEYDMDFELGNEPNNYPGWYRFTISGEEMANDYQLMRFILNSYQSHRNSRLIGPAIGSPFTRQYREFLETGGLDHVDAVTFHHYYGVGEGQQLSFFLDPVVLDTLIPILQHAVSLVKRNSTDSRKQVWLGETASCYNGGTAGISNSYAAGFMWMDKLGLCALHGIDAVFRHTFFMGHYAMTDNKTIPNPDYWLSLLYRTLIGNQVLTVKSNLDGESAKYLRFYAHKNETHTILFGMNLLNETADVRLNGRTDPAVQFLLEPKDGDLTAKQVLLNGRELVFDGKESPIVTNLGLLVEQPIKIPSQRFGMWVWNN